MGFPVKKTRVGAPTNLIEFTVIYCLYFTGGAALDNDTVIRIAQDVARGMAFLHAHEPAVHGYYLSSNNVMVRAKFIGLFRVTSCLTSCLTSCI